MGGTGGGVGLTTTVENSSVTGRATSHRTGGDSSSRRRALRAYYNVKKAGGEELAGADFNAQTYVDSLVHTLDLKHLLRREVQLLHDSQNIQAERKALVYDNYQKLIQASETVSKVPTSDTVTTEG